jgi:hypothetical protein
LLFSWREKAQTLADGRRLPREQDLPQAMDARKAAAYFTEQSRKARRETDVFRKKLRERMESAQDLVRVALHQQRQLAVRAGERRISAKTANDENRRLQEEIRKRGEEANLCHRVLALESAEDLGGFIDLPLPRYARELERFLVSDSSDSNTGDRDHAGTGKEAASPNTSYWLERLRSLAPKRLGRWDFIAIGAAGIAVLLALLYFLYSTQFAGAVAFDLLPAPQGAWVLSAENRTAHTVTVAVPGNAGQGTARADYAVFVEMRESGQTEFRRLPDADRAWVYGGTAGSDNGPVGVASRMTAKWTLSPGLLSVPGPDALLRIVVTSGHKPVFAQELAFETKSGGGATAPKQPS